MTIEFTTTEVIGGEEILSAPALAFVEELHRRFAGTRELLLSNRHVRRDIALQTGRLDFLIDRPLPPGKTTRV